MSASFWISLIGCVLSLLLPFLDHGETWEAFTRSRGRERLRAASRVIFLWGIPAVFLIATIVSGVESTIANANDQQRSQVLAATSNRVARAETTILELRVAVLPRRISPLQSDAFKKILNDPNNVCKTRVRVIVGQMDQETETFANAFKRMLDETGYTTTNEAIAVIPGFRVFPADGYDPKPVPVIAVFSSTNQYIQIHPTNGFGATVRVFYPTKDAGTTNVTIAYFDEDQTIHTKDFMDLGKTPAQIHQHPIRDPNDVLRGISDVLKFIGMDVGATSGYGTLNPGEVAFFIPQRVY